MAAFTADSINISNGRDVAEVISQEAINTIQKGDFLVISGFPPVEILQAYKNGQGERFIELLKPWPHTSQSNQPAIVIPTTVDYREAVEALRAANTLVSDNKKAMSDWQTNMGTVTFKDKDGNDVFVKTLRQIEADNQAQMNAYHPYPWAMRKVEFEAMRAANRRKFAADGWVQFGKHRILGDDFEKINEGLYTYKSGANQLLAGRAQSTGNAVGKSKNDLPVVLIGGVETELVAISGPEAYGAVIKLPPAEDGTRTYDSVSGAPTIHATPALAFASETPTNKVVTDRVDLWAFKGALREINEADPSVYKHGLKQSTASNIDGVPTSANTTMPDSYFAWFEGDTSSRGNDVNWLTATESERIAIASNPKNLIFFDDETGKFYQWTVQGLSWAGFGNGDWQYIDVQTTATLRFDINNAITDVDNGYYVGLGNSKYNRGNIGSYQKYKSNALTGEYLLIGTPVERLNKGAYHPSLNPLGTKYFAADNTGDGSINTHSAWYSVSSIQPTTVDCFTPLAIGSSGIIGADARTLAGAIGGGSGRPDGRFYDGICENGQGGVCRDMRYSAWGLTAEDFAEQDLNIKSGTYRGREVLLKTQFIPETVTVASSAHYVSQNAGGTIQFDTSASDNPRNQTTVEFGGLKSSHWLLCGDNGETMVIERVSINSSDFVAWPHSSNDCFLYASGDVVDEFNLKFPIGTKLWVGAMYPSGVSVADEFTHTEVIGDPSNILLCDDLKDGWVGSWNPTIPDGSGTRFEIARPVASNTDDIVTYSNDLGASWATTTSSHNLDLVTNSVSHATVFADGGVAIYQFKTKAKVTKPTSNTDVYSLTPSSGVWYLMRNQDSRGSGLMFSLTGLIPSSSGVGNYTGVSGIKNLFTDPETGKLSVYTEHTHEPLELSVPSNSGPAVKALNYNVVENQQAFINYAYTELHYDATAGDWGDDGVIHPANNQTTMPDENGHTVLVGTARCVEPLGWIKNDK